LNYVNDVSYGVNMPRLGTKDGVAAPFVLAPLAEQKVIADKLDTLLAQVENTKARLDRIPQILKRFRQSVLAAAVSGRLTEEWRPNFGSYVHALAEDWKWAPVPETWEVKLYPDLVESRLGKMLDKAKNSGLTTKYLGNINVRWFDFNLSEVQEILVSEAERNELSIRPGDVLICEGGEPGRCAIWDGRVEEQMVFQKALHRARVSDALLPEWLALNLKHDADSLTLEQLFTGTTIKHLTGKALKKYPLRVPPIKEQTEIVRRVYQLFTHADRIEQQFNNALARVNNLTQSILAKAFRGELTEQWRKDNPELISGKNSAEALLERIKAERAAVKPAKRIRRKTNA
jgi:type I restriction enzyme S subunit